MKLDAVEYYLECYTKALKPGGMDLWYVDAFAGSGDREALREKGGLFEGGPIETVFETLDGSARRALKVNPPFDHFVFIEDDPERCAALEAVRAEFPDRDIRIVGGDANEALRKVFGVAPWNRSGRHGSRAVVFLDPFAMQVDWSLLTELATTKAVDVWYLFPLAAVTRQLARSLSAVGNKAAALDRVLSHRWRELYSLPADDVPPTLFDQPKPDEKRHASKAQIEGWFTGLLEDVFPFVSEPLPIVTGRGHAFSLFLVVANPSQKATDLAKRFVRYATRPSAPRRASRRKSDR